MAEQSWASTPAVRSSMQSNKSRDTKPELAVRRAIHALGLRYRVCERPLPAVCRTVDVVFRRAQVAVEVRGCFWHGCAEHYRGPVADGGYWADKAARNIARDADTERRLAEARVEGGSNAVTEPGRLPQARVGTSRGPDRAGQGAARP